MKRWIPLVLLVACGDDDASPPDAATGTCNPTTTPLALDEIGLLDDRPIDLKVPPDDTRLFVIEQTGFVRILDGDDNLLAEPFLDLSEQVRQSGDEAGLLGIAFHPDYAQNRRFFVYFSTADEQSVALAEGKASADDPDLAEPTVNILLTAPHPASNHNGGWIDFGPDGFLYVGIGDGGGANDPQGNGQNSEVLLGKILRLDVDSEGEVRIPPGNPFADGGGRAEIWATGMRNPWRNSFDAGSGALYLADVGQGDWEEINVQPPGSAGGINYGWNSMEGTHCFEPSSGCATEGLTLPIYEYGHTGAGGSITGGYVYRGDAIAGCRGSYFFADYKQVFVRSLLWDGAAGISEQADWPDLAKVGDSGVLVATFGQDANGELLLADINANRVYRVVPAGP